MKKKTRLVCQDCGKEALPCYVKGDRCARWIEKEPKYWCGGRLDEEEVREEDRDSANGS